MCFSNAGAKKPQTCQRMIGSASRTPAQRLTQNAVRNGSVTSNVTAVAAVRQRPVQPVEDVVEDVGERRRRDDRDQAEEDACAELTEVLDNGRLFPVLEATRQKAHGLDRVVFALAGADGCPNRLLDRRSGGELGRLMVVLRHRVLELAHPRPERAPHLGKPLRAEDEKDDQEQDQQFPRTD